jgi:superfamily II DNA helicase RecQ
MGGKSLSFEGSALLKRLKTTIAMIPLVALMEDTAKKFKSAGVTHIRWNGN